MKIQELTLKDFKSFVIENIFENMEFQYSLDEYLERYRTIFDVAGILFKFSERRKSMNDLYCAYLSFSFQVEKKELYYYNLTNLRLMFKEFIDMKKLEGVKSFEVYTSYHSTDEYAFDFDLTIWIEEL